MTPIDGPGAADTLAATLLSGIPLPALIVGGDERMRAMNPAAQALLGVAAQGRHHAMALRHPQVQAVLTAALREGVPGTARQVVPGETSDTIHRVTVTPLPQGMGALLVLEDMSEAQQMEAMRRDFVANVSHELRSPLTALTGFIETLKGPARDDAAARARFLDIMEREAGRMNRLIRDLLQLSRVESEERVRPTQIIDVVDLLRSTKATLRPLAESSGVEVRIDLQDGVQTRLPGDPDQLTQVFQNLIENAVKYGGAGGDVILRLSADSLPKGPALRIEVIDHGEGIDPVHLPRLTERFYRVDSHRSREKGGTGLGLAIVKHIVQRHRGRIRITSEKGQGSTFAVILPLTLAP